MFSGTKHSHTYSNNINFNNYKMKKEIENLLHFILDEKHINDTEEYISDGEMLDMVVTSLQKILNNTSYE